ncbi:MAG: T9SS type A sorting domain-containing protein, partial [Bacteroidia bacterium]|nr:T9SS type A sorting domain-containing protein [Bacteroidia bacterium]
LSSKTIAGKGIVPGIAVCGIIDTVTYKPKSGFPFSNRPQYLSSYVQYMPADPADSSSIKVLLTKWNSSLLQRDTVAFGASYFNAMAHSWFNNGTFLNYMSGENPDSAIIVISSSSNVPKNGSYIYVDNLQFVGNVVGVIENNLKENSISVFPNPSNGNVNIDFYVEPDKASTLMIYDINGKLIHEVNELSKTNSINVSQWSKGIYTVQIKSNNQFINKKLTIN